VSVGYYPVLLFSDNGITHKSMIIKIIHSMKMVPWTSHNITLLSLLVQKVAK